MTTTQLYRMLDDPSATARPCSPCTVDEASYWNTPERGHGIFATVNTFRGGVRRKDHLVAINAWAIDMDDGTKDEQARRIVSAPLIPSVVVETKRGFQVYWEAQDGAKAEHWNAIVLERLVPHFGADKNARDLCRILRAPGYLHLKDTADPFLVRARRVSSARYSERQMAEAFRWVCNEQARRELHAAQRPAPRQAGDIVGERFWDAVYNLDCCEGLLRLSGHWSVRGESFTLRPQANGNWNVFVDGKGTSCFVDANRRIGSLDGGGPTLYQWLRWYGNKERECAQILKDLFPRLAEIDEAERREYRSRRVA